MTTTEPEGLEGVLGGPACHRVRIGRRSDFAAGLGRVEVDGRRIVVVSLGDELVALDDGCTHEEASLAEEGEVDEYAREIECCKHGARFSLDDGAATSLPATDGLRVYPVVFDGDDVFIELVP